MSEREERNDLNAGEHTASLPAPRFRPLAFERVPLSEHIERKPLQEIMDLA